MRVLITGGASGIGRAVAEMLVHRLGPAASLMLADRDSAQLAKVVAELSDRGSRVVGAVADLSDPASARPLIEQAQRDLGGLDGLVSNAGLVRPGALQDLSLEDYETVFAVNTRATWLLAKYAYPLLKESKGSIVATGSLASENPGLALGTYSASKAALVMLVRQMSVEWGPDGIRCNCVSPGAVVTPMTGNFTDPERRRRRSAGTALGRIAEAQDVAAAIVFLLGPDSSYISGVNLMVDGGAGGMLLPLISSAGGPGQT